MLKAYLSAQGYPAEQIVGSEARSSDRCASRVFVSHLYRERENEPYRLRIWLHVPEAKSGEPAVDPKAIAGAVEDFILNKAFQGSAVTLNAAGSELLEKNS